MTSNTHTSKRSIPFHFNPIIVRITPWKGKTFPFSRGKLFLTFLFSPSVFLYMSLYMVVTRLYASSHFCMPYLSCLWMEKKNVDYIVRSLISRLSSLPRFHRSSFIFPNIWMNKAPCLGGSQRRNLWSWIGILPVRCLWLFWAMIKDHLGHVKYVQDTEREIEGKKRWWMHLFFCTVASVFYFLSSSLVSSPPTYCSPNTHDTKSCLLCVTFIPFA